MSTRKSTGSAGVKVENVDSAKEKDNDASSSVNDDDEGKTTSDPVESIQPTKLETDSTTRASTPTQKDAAKSGSGAANSNSRVTRNSPLLISPNSRKDQPNADSEPTNSEGEEGSQAKKQIRGRKSIKEAKESANKEQAKENVNNKPTEEPIESKDKVAVSNKDNKEKEQKDKEKDTKHIKEIKEKKDVEDDTQVKDCSKANDEKDVKDLTENAEKKDAKDTKENNDKDVVRDTKECNDKDIKDSKETKDEDLKEPKNVKEAAVVSNRLTRNAAAQENASKSRITRNRQSSAGSSTRPETPPTARRGRPCNAAKKAAEMALSQKRKRSVEETADSPISKVIKIEPKDISDAPEEDESNVTIPLSGNTDLDAVRVKQELIESDDGSSTIGESTVAVTAVATTTTRGRGGNRWAGRKPTQTASPSTRTTRQNKVASPVTSNSPVPERKRRRTAGVNNRRGSSLTKSASTHATPDEDSKDSMASSMDDILLTDIKIEKLTPDIEENQDIEMETKKSATEEVADESMESTAKTLTDGEAVEPLTVETEIKVEAVIQDEAPVEASTSESAANSLNKDASLSPELVSEGVSEISVKQFYNRPKFLENNLGIEEDPKLGEIVQKVTTELDCPTECTQSKEAADASDVKETANGESAPVDALVDNEVDEIAVETNNSQDESFSAESLKEGDLMYEESNDGKKSPIVENPIKLPTMDSAPAIIEDAKVFEDKTEDKATTESASSEAKEEEEELLEERLVMAEEDLDDDDLTVEESETISMDNNPSLHDDAQEEEQDVEEDESQVDELPVDINPDVVPDDVLVDQITVEETKQTSNECDIKKAKLQEESEKENEIKEDEKKHLKIENELVEECVVKTAEKEEVKETPDESSQKEKDAAQSAVSEKETKSVKADDKPNVQPLMTKEFKNEERKTKSIIVTKFDSDEKEPPTPTATEELKAVEKDIKMDHEITEAENCETGKLEPEESILTLSEPMEISELKAEPLETAEIVKDEKQSLLTEQTTVEKMDISQPVSPKDEKNCNTSNSNSPIKSTSRVQRDSKDEDATSVKSTQSTDGNSWTTIEPDCDDEEKLRQKEQHFKNLGLLTHKAAEKRRQEFIQTAAAIEANRATAVSHHHSKRNGNKQSTALTNSSNSGPTTHEYTGTLKTVIKLNRNSSGAATGSTTTMTVTAASTGNGGRKSHITNSKDHNSGARRQSLKMTFQKGRGRGHTTHGNDRTGSAYSAAHSGDHHEHGEDSYYTIQNENEGAQKISSGSSLSTATAGTKDQQSQKQHIINNNSSNVQTHGRKPYNSRSNTSNSYNHYQNHHFATNSSHIDSSHSEGHHDGTTHPSVAHPSTGIISHKKDDREEILIPEKASSFKFHPGRLCEDQCYYCSGKFGLYDTPCHVGQIKSVERQQKILKNEEKLTVDNCLCDACFRHVDRRANVPSYKKRLSAPGHLENVNASGEVNAEDGTASTNVEEAEGTRKCVVPDCEHPASHSLRRKCIRKSVKKFLLNFDMPTGSPYIWLCQSHYDAVIQCSGCVLCKRRLGKNHMYHITSDTERLEKALTDMGIPVQLGIGTAVCKLCRYFANLLMKPPDSTKSQKAEFVKNYRKRLLQFHNIHDGSNDVSEADEDENNQNNSKTTEAGATTTKGAKSTNSRRKDQGNTNSPTASSGSSVICVTENAVDHSEDIAALTSNSEKSQKKSTLLENEVLMDYGMSAQNSSGETSNDNSKSPIPSPASESEKQSSRLKAILQSEGKTKSSANSDLPCALLRANPNLSMRELFPGEEDLGLQFKAPFGSSNSQRTPEGWTRVQTFLQYDEPTRRLWEELQKPYGNQSSFLRHLILLEKYYRNGDLVLSANASSNASVYTQTVRQRLNSYDQGHCGGLDTATTTTSSKSPSPATKEKTKSTTDIPLVEINDDDEEENARGDSSNPNEGKLDVDDDVVMEGSPTVNENSPAKRRTRSVSVDKLTRQLTTNAVTIIARPKDATQASSANTSKSNNGDSLQKRTDLPKLQTTTSPSLQNSTSASSLPPLSTSTTAAMTTTVIPSGIASSSNNSRSILKSNLLGIANNKSVEILPIASQKSAGNANMVTATTVTVPSTAMENNSSNNSGSSSSNSKQQKILEVANKLLDSQMEAAAKQQNASLITSPPELVSLQRRGMSNAPAAAASSSSATNTSTTMSPTTASLINAKRPHLMSNRPTGHNRGSGLAPNVVILPSTLSQHERAESKSWRPTLMSVEENQHLLNKNGPLYQTADGRRLPGLVQVQSGGKPFLISIFDYNRMCILRREKLMRDGMLNSGKHKSQSQQQQQQRHMQQSSSNYNKMNSSGNNSSSSSNNNNNNSGSSGSSKHAQTNASQQQFLQMLHYQKQQQAALKAALKPAANSNNNRYHPIAPKPTSLSGNSGVSNMMPGSSNNTSGGNMSMNNASNSNQLSANQSNFPMPLLANALSNANAVSAAAAAAATLNNNPWLWSNFPDSHELLRNGAHGGLNKLPPLLPKPSTVPNTSAANNLTPPATITSKQLQQHQQQMLLDNTLMSKIPKSLTVIPQHKLMGNSSNAATKE